MPEVGNPVAFTGHAMRALQLSISFSQVFAEPIKEPLLHRLDLETPPGTSTGGGENVKQTVKLVVGRTNAVAVGVANADARRGEIFDFATVNAAFAAANGGAPFPFDAAQYAQLVMRLTSFFAKEKIALGPEPAAIAPAKPAAAPPSNIGRLLIVGAIVIVVAVTVIVFALR